ncbi:hypothetical protein HanIR_Chr02g0094921 [Helianthus annuus]|nr:hypothetical protein HanIR_Chr02g0094921 [Helianthus annuus]
MYVSHCTATHKYTIFVVRESKRLNIFHFLFSDNTFPPSSFLFCNAYGYYFFQISSVYTR